jgi:transcriptional regulator GlxA family with amidase domain
MHRIGLIISDHFQMLALSTLTVFEFANSWLIALLPVDGLFRTWRKVRSSSGIGVDSVTVERGNAWWIPGWWRGCFPMEEPASPAVIHFLQTSARQARRIAGICTGAFVLAQAGLLEQNAPLRTGRTHAVFLRCIPDSA